MRLPPFEYLNPRDFPEALDMLAAHGNACRILAGGTDLLVRMKQRLLKPKYLMSLKSLNMLDYIRQEDGELKIGPRTCLAKCVDSETIARVFPGFWQSVRSVGAPTIQHYAGTVGGNICQDSRCLFYNQSAFWRSGRQPCHKAGAQGLPAGIGAQGPLARGKTCHARKDSDRCHATFQSDCAPALIALDAKVTLSRAEGERTIPLADLYSTIGEQPLAIGPDELLAEIQIPIPPPDSGSAYHRLSFRSAIDYPIASAGVYVETENGKIRKARIVIGAISRAPLFLPQPGKRLEGCDVSDTETIKNTAVQAMEIASAFAVNNAGATVEYRTEMIGVMAERALADALAIASTPFAVRP